MSKEMLLQRISVVREDDGQPTHWQEVLFKDVYRLTKKPRNLHYSDFQQIPFIPMDMIPIGKASFSQFMLKSVEEISSGTYFEPGDILLAKITPSFENGKQGIIDNLPTPFGIATTEVIPIKELEGVSDKYFLFYYLLRQNVRMSLANKMEGSTGRQRLNLSTLLNMVILFPPLPEQRAIAYVLQIVQNAIQTRRREIELEQERKATLLKYLFTHGTGNEPTKQTEIGEMPESWQVVHLGSIYSIRYGLGQPPQLDPDGIPMVRATDIQSGRIDMKTVVKVKETAIPQSRKDFLKKGDIIVVRSGAYTGDIAMYNGEWQYAIAGYDLVATPTSKNINSNFIAAYLLGETSQRYFKSQRDRAAQPHLNAEQLRNIIVPFPSLVEQQDIATIVNAIQAKLISLEQEIILLEEFFHALLEELMTGRLSTIPLIEKESVS